MKPLALLGLSAALALAAPTAAADGKAECLGAAGDGQTLRDAHKLIEARDKFRICAAAGCPAAVQGDCASWLDAVEKALPSVVLTAKNGTGAPLVDVRVSLDGQPFATRLQGEAIPIDPGSHTFHFEALDGSTHDELAVISEGIKAQAVAVVIGAPTPATATPTPTASPEQGGSSGTLKTVGWVVGGAGVVGLGIGTIFGLVAIGDKNGAHCGSNGLCDPGTSAGIKSAALVSDVGWFAGGLLAAGGLALVLFAPGGGGRDHAAGVAVAPFIDRSGGGIAFRGRL